MSDDEPGIQRAFPAGLIVIPARLQSTRLPRKLLLCETGRPLLAHVIEQARLAVEHSHGLIGGVLVGCDHESLCDVAHACGVDCVMTSPAHRNGTARIAEAIQKRSLENSIDFVVNLQADQPELASGDIVALARLLNEDSTIEMGTLAVEMGMGFAELQASPDAVKIAIDAQNRAVSFSRSPIPHARSDRNAPQTPQWYFHVGAYAYRISILSNYENLPESEMGERENLEQLRFLEAGITIKVVVMPESSFPQSVDTRDDYCAFVRRWKTRCPTS